MSYTLVSVTHVHSNSNYSIAYHYRRDCWVERPWDGGSSWRERTEQSMRTTREPMPHWGMPRLRKSSGASWHIRSPH